MNRFFVVTGYCFVFFMLSIVCRAETKIPYAKFQNYVLDSFLTGKPAVFDFNNDGFLDIALANRLFPLNGVGSFAVYLGNEDGTYTIGKSCPTVIPSEVTFTSQITAGYFNDDAFADIALIMGNGSVWISYGRGDGTFDDPLQLLLKLPRSSLFDLPQVVYFRALDIDQDNRHELFIGRGLYSATSGWSSGGLEVYKNANTGWYKKEAIAIWDEILFAVGDLTGNQKYDIVSIEKLKGISLWLDDSRSYRIKKGPFPFSSIMEARSMSVGDLDDDGVDDIVVGNLRGTISVIEVDKGPVVTDRGVLADANHMEIITSVKVIDVDMDGMKDIIAVAGSNSSQKAELYYYKRTGSFKFDKAEKMEVPYSKCDLKADFIEDSFTYKDINYDGNVDIVIGSVGDSSSNKLMFSVLKNTTAFSHGIKLHEIPEANNRIRTFTFGGSHHTGNDLLKIALAGLEPYSVAILMWSPKTLPKTFYLNGIKEFAVIIPPVKQFAAFADHRGQIEFDIPVPLEKDLTKITHYFQWLVSENGKFSTSPAIEVKLWKKFLKEN